MRNSPIGAVLAFAPPLVFAPLVLALFLVALVALPFGIASADAAPLAGTVIEAQSRWGYDKTAIVTESVVLRADGSQVTVHQLGGSTGGIGMRVSHSPMVLREGDRVVLETSPKRTATGRYVQQVQSVLSIRGPLAAEKSAEDLDQREFARTRNSEEADIHWASGCAYLSVSTEGSTQIAGDREFQVIDEVLAHWTQETRSCSTFQFINEGLDDREVGFDGVNLIKFREDFWCRPATDNDPQECYDQAAAGLTTLFFIDDGGSGRNGEILDADMEFNGVQFAFAADGVTTGAQDCEADFSNTLTHELGHFIGLDHTCWTSGVRLLDNEGNLVPACSGPGLGPAITEATMYNFQSCGETLKSTLTADDAAGFCAIYPSESTPTSCKRADIEPAGCCSVAGTAKPSPPAWRGALLLLLLALGALALARRRTR
jgi:MYXO-CTERM domain-containing protein